MAAGMSGIQIFREREGDEAWSSIFINVGKGIFTCRDWWRFGK